MSKRKMIVPPMPLYRIIYQTKSGAIELGETFRLKSQAMKRLRKIQKMQRVRSATVKYIGSPR